MTRKRGTRTGPYCASGFIVRGIVAVVVGTGCGPLRSTDTVPGAVHSELVYGADGRTELYEGPQDRLSDVARHSLLAIIPRERMTRRTDGTWEVASRTATERYSLCEGERFSSQPAAAECSATLIDADLVLTAGHCAGSMSECAADAYVFNYWYEAPGELATIDDDSVYYCHSRVVFELDILGLAPIDIAVVQLDRPVSGNFQPVPVALGDGPPLGTQVAWMGTGEGVPIKVDRGGTVQAYVGVPPTGFKSNVDSFLGASGSGLFLVDGTLVGVLSSGQEDFESLADCRVSRFLDASSGAETAYWAKLAVQKACAVQPGRRRLCKEVIADGGAEAGLDAEPPDAMPATPGGDTSAADCDVSGPGDSGRGHAGLRLGVCLGVSFLQWVRRRGRASSRRHVPMRRPMRRTAP